MAEAPPPLRRNRDFLLLWGGQAASTLGSRVSAFAYPLLVLALTGSAALAGVAGFLATLPYLVLQLPAGVWVDRADRRRLMIGCDLARAAALASIGLASLAGVLSVAQIMAVAFAEGCLFVVFSAAERAALPHVVASEQLAAALAQNEARTRAAALAGQPLGGLLFGLSRSLPFLADAASYVFSLATLALIRRDFQAHERPASGRPLRELLEGVAWLWRQRFLRDTALLVAGSNLIFQALVLVLIVLLRRQGAAPGEIGLVLAGMGVGGVAGSLAAAWLERRLGPRLVVVGCNWVWAALFPLFALLTAPPALGAVLAGCALVGPLWNVVVGAYRLRLVPDALRGRVAAAGSMIAWGTIPLGSLAGGLLVDTFGARSAAAALALAMLAVAVAASASPAIRRGPALESGAAGA